MKLIFYFLLLFIFNSCIDEVTLDLKPNDAKIVIDASIQWNPKSEDNGANQVMKINQSTN